MIMRLSFVPIIVAAIMLASLILYNQLTISGNILGNEKNNDFSDLAKQVIPPEGFTINAKFGDIGPKLVQAGVIDIEKLKLLYNKTGRPLTQEQLEILTKGSNDKITINLNNSSFILNLLWALGLANKNPLLTELAEDKEFAGYLGNLASTGGWILGKEDGGKLWGKYEIVKLTPQQQEIVEFVAKNSYRPCCNNPTAFPDCNHGSAALGLIELMASQGASKNEILQALKQYNSYWFPQQYYELALYFKNKEGKNWDEVDPLIVLSKNYSSYSGWATVNSWLQKNGLLEQLPTSGGACGV